MWNFFAFHHVAFLTPALPQPVNDDDSFAPSSLRGLARVFTALYLLSVLSGHAEAFAIKQPIVVLGRATPDTGRVPCGAGCKPVALPQRKVCARVTAEIWPLVVPGGNLRKGLVRRIR